MSIPQFAAGSDSNLIAEALERSQGVKRDAAEALGIDPRNLSYYLKKHGLGSGS